jgi:hypothetical protein
VTLRHGLVDSTAMDIITKPRSFDVVVTENMFGDILTDEVPGETRIVWNERKKKKCKICRGKTPIAGISPFTKKKKERKERRKRERKEERKKEMEPPTQPVIAAFSVFLIFISFFFFFYYYYYCLNSSMDTSTKPSIRPLCCLARWGCCRRRR